MKFRRHVHGDLVNSTAFVRRGGVFVLLGVALLTISVFSPANEQAAARAQQTTTVQKKNLWVITSRTMTEPLEVAVGDVLQFVPFELPVTRDFLDSKIRPKLTGDVTLEPIGEASVTKADGRVGLSYFFLVREQGKTAITLELLNAEKSPMSGFKAEYEVTSRDRRAG